MKRNLMLKFLTVIIAAYLVLMWLLSYFIAELRDNVWSIIFANVFIVALMIVINLWDSEKTHKETQPAKVK